jgi:ABC-type polysaccharide/polyol phosphate transport system ATPase subunit
MLPEGTIAARHVWKRFKADQGRTLLQDKLQKLVHPRQFGRGYRMALRDISFEITPGESVGLFGVNGSGKSTLLKILNRVMYPYAGIVDVSGRVGALIEVRAGIHPELTGRENVYLAGSFLGLKRQEVARRFDAIVDFAEVEGAIDRQVKFYSSGMQMRIGFAVAAFLEPHILLVDEVLAVGDASFQQKCLDRMRQVLNQGTTLILVSHDLAAIEATCRRGIFLTQGVVVDDGPVREVLGEYRRSIEEHAQLAPAQDGPVRIVEARAADPDGGLPKSEGRLRLEFEVQAEQSRRGRFYFGMSEGPATPIFLIGKEVSVPVGRTLVSCTIERLPLPRGRYFVWCGLFDLGGSDLVGWHPAVHVDVSGPALDEGPAAIVRLAPVHVGSSWSVQ